jgi:hypothetical protein
MNARIRTGSWFKRFLYFVLIAVRCFRVTPGISVLHYTRAYLSIQLREAIALVFNKMWAKYFDDVREKERNMEEEKTK